MATQRKRGSDDRPRSAVSPPPSKRRVESTTTKKSITSFFTPTSAKDPHELNWRVVHRTLLVARYNPHVVSGLQASDAPGTNVRRRKIAAFDLDSTLIKTVSGNLHAKDASDWRWWHTCVPSTLKQLYADGYVIVVITNQGSLSLKRDQKIVKSESARLADFKSKVGAIFGQLEFPITLLAATARDQFRKPRTRMWFEVLEEFDLDSSGGPLISACFFVGDAGGRPARSDAKADHSCVDRNFATNVGIDFKTPEEYFLNEKRQPFIRDFEPSDYLSTASSSSNSDTPRLMLKQHALDVVLLCGSPASGKTTFYWKSLKPLGYEHINQDTLKTRAKCVKVASDFLAQGMAVAIDNTNGDLETRAVWIRLSESFGLPIRCVFFSTPPKLCEHNNIVRALAGDAFNPENRSILPHLAFSSFASRFIKPSTAEGFKDVITLEFKFEGEEQQRQIWSKYWV
ncbi:hypothetical protein MMC31_002440 [Peltigera leucophlebia]|nr:hypothetical protein [Peltigera leucophlebia]